MSEKARKGRANFDRLGLVSFGFFLILVGMIWAFTPNITEAVVEFGKDLGSHFQTIGGNVTLPVPEQSHPVVYSAAMQFCIIFALSEIFILGLRLVFHDSIDRMAGDVSGMAFWFSAGYFLYLLANASISWFGFLAGIIISAGLAIVASSLVKLLRRERR